LRVEEGVNLVMKILIEEKRLESNENKMVKEEKLRK
jgi:hypothetical protein